MTTATKVVLWVDPKEHFTALNAASKEGHAPVVQQLLAAASRAYGGENTEGFRRFLEHLDKDQFSPLNTASKEGHAPVVQQLLAAALKARYTNLDTWFFEFIEQKNRHGFTPLNAACNAYSKQLLGKKEAELAKIVDILLSFNADTTSRNIYHKDPKMNAPMLFGPYFGPRNWTQSTAAFVSAVDSDTEVEYNRSAYQV